MLEHLSRPVEALRALQGVLKPGGTITVIEGDHGSAYFHPDSAAAHDAIECLVTLQREGGDSEIGRRLYPVLCEAGFEDVRVSPRLVYVDDSRPRLVDGFTRKTFTAMIEGVREPAIARGLISAERFDRGSATSTARPRAAGRSSTRSSRASGGILQRTLIQRELDLHARRLVAGRDGPAGAVRATQPHPHRSALAAQVAPPGLALG